MHVMRNFDQIEVSHRRRRRAYAVVGAAALLFLIGGLLYLRPGASRPNPSATARSTVVLTSPEPVAAVVAAAFLNATTGYVEFEAPGFARVFRTADAGAHWRLVYEGEPLTYLHALDESQVLMATGLRRILASTDGGLHWRVIPPADPADSTGHVAFATYDDALALAGAGSFLVVRTDDAGSHWSPPALRGFPSPGHVLAAGYRPDGSGWVITEPLAISRAPDVYLSNNRGDDWQLRALPPVEAPQDLVVRDDGTTLYALRTFTVNRPGEGMGLYSLPRGADDWALLDPPPVPNAPMIAAAGGTLWATSGRELWAYQDGVWQRRADLPGAGSTVYLAAFDSTVLLAQTQEIGHVLLSADGGRHWSKLSTPS